MAPHAAPFVPVWQPPSESQQPGQEAALQAHAPFMQSWPDGQLPVWQMPPQPSAAPQIEQEGVQQPPSARHA